MSLTQISLDEAALASLDAAAAAREISREDAVLEAIRNLSEYDEWFRRKVEAGEKAYREGRFITQEEATHRAEQRRLQILKAAGQQ